MTLHPLHPARRERVAEIDDKTYFRLMRELTFAGAQECPSYGDGRIGSHPDHGEIAVARVEWPARLNDHPPVAYFLECKDEEALSGVMTALGHPVPAKTATHVDRLLLRSEVVDAQDLPRA